MQQFQSDEPLPSDAPLRAQRMTADEAASVIVFWQQEQIAQTGLTDQPAVPDVAEGLDISVDDVQRLLQAVRAQRLAEENALAAQNLADVRLAEEERRLAETRRQRAELQCEQAEAARQIEVMSPETHLQTVPIAKRGGNSSWIVAILIVSIVLLLSLAAMTTRRSGTVPCYINKQAATSEDCMSLEHGNYTVIQKYTKNDHQ